MLHVLSVFPELLNYITSLNVVNMQKHVFALSKTYIYSII